MSKQEFIARLQKGLSGVPKDEAEGRISFYAELIDDRMEEGLSEEEAVLAVGSVEDIIAQIVAEIPFVKIAKERILSKRRLGVGEIILLILGSPIWISLCVAAFAVVLSLYISLWAVIVSLWAAGITSCSTTISPQRVHCSPRVKPSVVQVAALPAIVFF